MRKPYTRQGARQLLLLAALLAALLTVGLAGCGGEEPADPPAPERQEEASTPDGGTAEPAPEPEPTPAPHPEPALPEDPDRMTTESGIVCVRTELPEEAIHRGELIVVNNTTYFVFPEDQEAGLDRVLDKKTRDYIVRDGTVLLEPAAMEALNHMMADFKAQGGPSRSVNVVAGHRTAEFQQHLFDQSAQRNGLDHAQRYVAQPGGSEHHTGYALDLNILQEDGSSREYDGKGPYAWINENCQNYGFVVRYAPDKQDITGIDAEAWHFRYVGAPHAAEMVENHLCLEEYADYLKGFPFAGEHLTISCGAGTYEVWYCEGTEAYLPEEGEYTLSGNNTDGVIVTVKVG